MPQPSAPETIAVIGTRFQLQGQIAHIFDTPLISDSLVQDDIGRQPDFNIVDATRRLVGVVSIRDEEEAIAIGIRGLSPDYVLVSLDNMAFASEPSLPERRDFVETLPAALFKAIEVIKVRDGSHEGQMIGGGVNLQTRSAFDRHDPFASLNLSLGHFTADGFDAMANPVAVRADAALARTFGEKEKIGLVLAGSYFLRHQDEERYLAYYDNAQFVPDFLIWNGIENRLERFGGFAKFEMRPYSHLRVDLSGRFFEQKERFYRQSLVLAGDVDHAQIQVHSGRVEQVSGGLESLDTPSLQRLWGLGIDAHYDLGSNDRIQFQLAYSQSLYRDGDGGRSDVHYAYRGPPGGLDFEYDYSQARTPSRINFINIAPAADLSHYHLTRIETKTARNEGRVFSARMDFTHNFGTTPYSLTGGVFHRTSERRFDGERYGYDFNGQAPILLNEQGQFSAHYRAPYAPLMSVIIGNDRALALKALRPEDFIYTQSLRDTWGRDFAVRDGVSAAYGEVIYAHGPWHGGVGLRYEMSDLSLKTYSLIKSRIALNERTQSYGDVLASAYLSYDVTQDIRLRAAYYQAIARVNYPDLLASVRENPLDVPLPLTLNARHANNYDLSAQWRFDNAQSLIVLGAFRKVIQDEIIYAPSDRLRPLNAGRAEVTGFELNLIKSKFSGLPAPLNHLGVSANYTYIAAQTHIESGQKPKASLTFHQRVEQPEHLLNFVGFYQDGSFEARLAYNFTGGYLKTQDLFTPQRQTYIDDYQTLDAQIRWHLRPSTIVLLEGRNLTNTRSQELTGPDHNLVTDYSLFGQALFMGFHWQY
ncbi:TonB-dependent receptor [Woodsholea maritima]|uniref:TonB-dependent receptor n=1 Tax=Woodsholea maritima TaxID=240237 RepID=UPI0003A6A342|nr:TonB-dependent receptor [Woodsholea maritima]